jgi:hypothetical protein
MGYKSACATARDDPPAMTLVVHSGSGRRVGVVEMMGRWIWLFWLSLFLTRDESFNWMLAPRQLDRVETRSSSNSQPNGGGTVLLMAMFPVTVSVGMVMVIVNIDGESEGECACDDDVEHYGTPSACCR